MKRQTETIALNCLCTQCGETVLNYEYDTARQFDDQLCEPCQRNLKNS